jgi:imidazole glycerol-phosphate synthase subunit HisF
MLQPRIIPCLLIKNNGLVKTVKFKDPKYVGDPINAVKIFNEKEVDELIVIDIDATTLSKEPNYKLIENMAVECRMPLCYVGGIKTAEQAGRIFSLGVEKIGISSSAIYNPILVADMAQKVGNQSVVVVLDVKKKLLGGYEVYTHNGSKATGIDALKLVVKLESLGVGEIVINSIDNDGLMQGFDKQLIRSIRDSVSVPLTFLGGASKLEDVGELIAEYGILGIAVGSLFVFKGKFRAVLINYPTPIEKNQLLQRYFYPKWGN